MLFYYLYVEFLAKEFGGLFDQFYQQVYAYRKVCRAEYRHIFGARLYVFKLLLCIPRCGYNGGYAVLFAVVKLALKAGGGGKVYNNVYLFADLVKGLINLALEVFGGAHIHAAYRAGILVALE